MHRQGYGSAYGLTLNPFSDAAELMRASAKQVGLASTGLSSVSALDSSAFEQAPSNLQGAYLRAAYWIAVSSRLLGGNLGLASSAAMYQAKAGAASLAPEAALRVDPAKIVAVIKDAARTIAIGAGARAHIVAEPLTILGKMTASSVSARQADTGSLVTQTVDYATDKTDKPPGMPEWLWWVDKNKGTIGLSLVGIALLYGAWKVSK